MMVTPPKPALTKDTSTVMTNNVEAMLRQSQLLEHEFNLNQSIQWTPKSYNASASFTTEATVWKSKSGKTQ